MFHLFLSAHFEISFNQIKNCELESRDNSILFTRQFCRHFIRLNSKIYVTIFSLTHSFGKNEKWRNSSIDSLFFYAFNVTTCDEVIIARCLCQWCQATIVTVLCVMTTTTGSVNFHYEIIYRDNGYAFRIKNEIWFALQSIDGSAVQYNEIMSKTPEWMDSYFVWMSVFVVAEMKTDRFRPSLPIRIAFVRFTILLTAFGCMSHELYNKRRAECRASTSYLLLHLSVGTIECVSLAFECDCETLHVISLMTGATFKGRNSNHLQCNEHVDGWTCFSVFSSSSFSSV